MNWKNWLYQRAGQRGQSFISRTKYTVGIRPYVDRQQPDFGKLKSLYPSSHNACLIISVDFELAWAWCRVNGKPEPLSYARDMARQARQNFPELLSMFEHYGIPATWATVGHLFLERCSMKDGQVHPEVLRIPYFANEYWNYTEGDWFGIEPGSTFQNADRKSVV